MFSAARNEHLPDILAMVHVKKYTPLPAIILTVSIHIFYNRICLQNFCK